MKSVFTFIVTLIALQTYGQVMVKDIYPGPTSSTSLFLVQMGSYAYFASNDGVHGVELWKTDGTEIGTSMVIDLNPGYANGLYYCVPCPGGCCGYTTQLTVMNDTLYFWGNDSIHGFELWKSDGTAAGTTLVKDIYPGLQKSTAWLTLCTVGNKILFEAEDGISGKKAWISDGTDSGTKLLVNAYGNLITYPDAFFVYGQKAYFQTVSNDSLNPLGIWVSDGTSAGTIVDTFPNASAILSFPFIGWHDGVYVSVKTPGLYEIWRIDTTDAHTSFIKSSPNVANPYIGLDNSLLLVLGDSTGSSLWSTDGTMTGTSFVKAIPGGTTNSRFTTFFNHNGYFIAFEQNHWVIYKTDGTSNGTFIALVYSETNSLFSPMSSIVFDNVLLYTSRTVQEGVELWQTDGSSTHIMGDVCPGSCSSMPHGFFIFGSIVLFMAYDDVHGFELWKIDSTMTSVQEYESDNFISNVYPNPFSSQFEIVLNNNEETTIILYDIFSQKILQQSFTNSTTINTAQLADGIYIYELRNDRGNVKNGKLVKQ